ncbi:MAG: ABC transporter ATP-binding protein, partial [Bacteroidales bacterium]
LEKKKMDTLRELERKKCEEKSAEPEQKSEGKLSYEARREVQKEIRKIERLVADSEKAIARIEEKVAGVEAKLATPEGASDVALYEEHGNLKRELDAATDQWMEHTMALEELQSQL